MLVSAATKERRRCAVPARVVKRKSVPGADIKGVKDEFVREWRRQLDWQLNSAVTRALARVDPTPDERYQRGYRRPYRWPKGRSVVYVRVRIPGLPPPPFAGSRPRVAFEPQSPFGEFPEERRRGYAAAVESVTWGRRGYPSASVRMRLM